MTTSNAPRLSDARYSHLIVIDVQTRLTQVMSDRKSLLRNCEILLNAANLLSVPVTLTEQYPKGLGNIEPNLMHAIPAGVIPIEKTCFSCCNAGGFEDRVLNKENRQLILCGIESHVCVLQTAMDLLDRNCQVFVVADAIDSRFKEHRQVALGRMQQAGAMITTTESVLFEWLRDARHEQFKAVSALIR
ncbi:MAG: hydrolase [Gammaproteobacteria bacterium]|nr:hydrolase [Gammaproteobacteria bacterium]